jgi:hypothetical protein
MEVSQQAQRPPGVGSARLNAGRAEVLYTRLLSRTAITEGA